MPDTSNKPSSSGSTSISLQRGGLNIGIQHNAKSGTNVGIGLKLPFGKINIAAATGKLPNNSTKNLSMSLQGPMGLSLNLSRSMAGPNKVNTPEMANNISSSGINSDKGQTLSLGLFGRGGLNLDIAKFASNNNPGRSTSESNRHSSFSQLGHAARALSNIPGLNLSLTHTTTDEHGNTHSRRLDFSNNDNGFTMGLSKMDQHGVESFSMSQSQFDNPRLGEHHWFQAISQTKTDFASGITANRTMSRAMTKIDQRQQTVSNHSDSYMAEQFSLHESIRQENGHGNREFSRSQTLFHDNQ